MFGRTGSQRMNGMVTRLAPLVVMMLLTSACQQAPTTFRPPNKDELAIFIRDQGISPIADKLWNDSTVLLYETGTSFGYYTLTVREPDGTLIASGNVSAKSNQPILVIGQLTGNRPFMAVVIQDATLAAEATAIEVVIDSQNRLGATTNSPAGAILVSPSPVNAWGTVALYNAQGEILYSQEWDDDFASRRLDPTELTPPDSDTPAAGICADAYGEWATVEIWPDGPSPRCLKVTGLQRLKIINCTKALVDIQVGQFTLELQPGTEGALETPLGSFLASGVHRVLALPYSGPELWLVETTHE